MKSLKGAINMKKNMNFVLYFLLIVSMLMCSCEKKKGLECENNPTEKTGNNFGIVTVEQINDDYIKTMLICAYSDGKFMSIEDLTANGEKIGALFDSGCFENGIELKNISLDFLGTNNAVVFQNGIGGKCDIRNEIIFSDSNAEFYAYVYLQSIKLTGVKENQIGVIGNVKVNNFGECVLSVSDNSIKTENYSVDISEDECIKTELMSGFEIDSKQYFVLKREYVYGSIAYQVYFLDNDGIKRISHISFEEA